MSSCGPPTFTTAALADYHSGAVCCVCHGSRMATSCSLRPGMLLRGRTKPFLCVNGLFCVRLNTFCSRRRRKFNLQASRPPRGCRCACTPKPLLTDVYFFMAHQSPAPLSVHLSRSLSLCPSLSLFLDPLLPSSWADSWLRRLTGPIVPAPHGGKGTAARAPLAASAGSHGRMQVSHINSLLNYPPDLRTTAIRRCSIPDTAVFILGAQHTCTMGRSLMCRKRMPVITAKLVET